MKVKSQAGQPEVTSTWSSTQRNIDSRMLNSLLSSPSDFPFLSGVKESHRACSTTYKVSVEGRGRIKASTEARSIERKKKNPRLPLCGSTTPRQRETGNEENSYFGKRSPTNGFCIVNLVSSVIQPRREVSCND